MNPPKLISLRRLSALIPSCTLPLAAIAIGIRAFALRMLITPASFLAFIVFPCCALAASILIIFSEIKVAKKWVLCSVFQIVFVIQFMTLLSLGEFKYLRSYRAEEVPAHYSEVTEVFDLMPQLTEIGQPEHIEYHNFTSQETVFFVCESDILICTYGLAEYEQQKASLDESYIFQQEPMLSGGFRCEPVVDIDGYRFRFLSIGREYSSQIAYPRRLIMVATNDEAREIAYIATSDSELDYIESISDYITDDCGWSHIRSD